MTPRPLPRAIAGFTLLEAIVTLVIVSLLVTVLMQALSHTLGIRERVVRFQGESRLETLQEQWFRDTVAAALPDLHDAYGPLRGDADEVDMLTLAPLSGAGPRRVRWRLQPVDGGFALHYIDGDDDRVVLRGPLSGAAFDYLDGPRGWRPSWSPETGDGIVLPQAIRLRADTVIGPLLWQANVITDPRIRPLLRPDDPANGL